MHRLATIAIPGFTAIAALTGFAVGHSTKPTLVISPHAEPCPVEHHAPSPPLEVPKLARPIGGQFLMNGPLLDHGGDMPVVFLLSAHELESHRYRLVMPRVANDLREELKAVLAEARCTDCGELEAALDSLDQPAWGTTQVKRWTVGEDIHTDHRRIALRSTGTPSLEVACELETWTVGMGMYNDVPSCELIVRDGKRTLASYHPGVEYQSGKEGLYVALESWFQVVQLPAHVITIHTGYKYLPPNDDMERQKIDEVNADITDEPVSSRP